MSDVVISPADFENQGAHHLAKQYDSDGKRTVGESLSNTLSSFLTQKY
jgi:hypothetical protein